jgi:hypothetical protein
MPYLYRVNEPNEGSATTKLGGDIVSRRWEGVHDGHQHRIRLVHPREPQRCSGSYPVGAARVLVEISVVVEHGRTGAAQELTINAIADAAHLRIELNPLTREAAMAAFAKSWRRES